MLLLIELLSGVKCLKFNVNLFPIFWFNNISFFSIFEFCFIRTGGWLILVDLKCIVNDMHLFFYSLFT